MATRTDESRSRSRTSETLTRIREDVISGKFPPGTKLKIGEIARALDVVARHRLQALPSGGALDPAWERCHKDFHMALIAACGSSILLRLCNQFFDENNRYRSIARTGVTDGRDVGCEHEAITDAVLSRDAELAVKLLLEHYKRTGNLLQKALLGKTDKIMPSNGDRKGRN